jgi:hypothetical protein
VTNKLAAVHHAAHVAADAAGRAKHAAAMKQAPSALLQQYANIYKPANTTVSALGPEKVSPLISGGASGSEGLGFTW